MKFLKIIGIILLPILIFIIYITSTTGYFRNIENKFDGTIVKSISVPGAEDIMVNREYQFALISSTERLVLREGTAKSGGLYYMDLKNEDFDPVLISQEFKKPFFPHGISMIKLDSAHFKILAINHVNLKHSIEVFHLYGDSLVHKETIKDKTLISPNDIVAIDENQFYFTNDHKNTEGLGQIAEDYFALAQTNVILYDGTSFNEVANGIVSANGINIDPTRNLLYVACPRVFLIKVYEIEKDHQLKYVEDIPCGSGVDNIEFDLAGRLWVGCHPDLLSFAAYAAQRNETAPSELIRINYKAKGDFEVESVFVDDGSQISATSVAAPYGDYIFAGNVMDDHFLVLKQ